MTRPWERTTSKGIVIRISALGQLLTSLRTIESSVSCHEQSLRIFQSAPAQSPSPGLAEKYLSNFPVSSQ